MRVDRLGDREADRLARVERGEGVLEDVLDLLAQPPRSAADIASMSWPSKRISPEIDFSSCWIVRPMVDLPRAGFADQRQRLAGIDVEADLLRPRAAMRDPAEHGLPDVEPGGQSSTDSSGVA